MNRHIFQALAEAARHGEPVALALISKAKGSSPQKSGAKALFYPDGRIAGTLGGGCLEAEVQRRALQALHNAATTTFELILDHDFGWDDGLICGGKIEGVIVPNAQQAGEDFWTQLAEPKARLTWGIQKEGGITWAETQAQDGAWLYREQVSPPCVLWVAGAGHIAQATAPLAARLDFAVTVFDDRPALASHNYFPAAISLKTGVWEDLVQLPLPDVPGFGLIVTRGHRHDALVLQSWIRKPFRFLGMIGSRRKARTIFSHFIEEKLATEEEVRRIVCPVGLDIGSQTPMEIAVSILAQLIQVRAEVNKTLRAG